MTGAPNVSTVRVRYGECDMQGVVFNAHYLAYVDDALDQWLRCCLGEPGAATLAGFEPMVRTLTIEFHRGLTYGDVATLTCSVRRWGRTSVDMAVVGTVGEVPSFEARVTYVNVDLGSKTPVPIGDRVREALAPYDASP